MAAPRYASGTDLAAPAWDRCGVRWPGDDGRAMTSLQSRSATASDRSTAAGGHRSRAPPTAGPHGHRWVAPWPPLATLRGLPGDRGRRLVPHRRGRPRHAPRRAPRRCAGLAAGPRVRHPGGRGGADRRTPRAHAAGRLGDLAGRPRRGRLRLRPWSRRRPDRRRRARLDRAAGRGPLRRRLRPRGGGHGHARGDPRHRAVVRSGRRLVAGALWTRGCARDRDRFRPGRDLGRGRPGHRPGDRRRPACGS